jgi:hypothetical protein
MKIILAAAIAAALSGCAGATREDQVEVRELRSGTRIVLTVVEDPADHPRCWSASSGLWCRTPPAAAGDAR